jgi:hypothetical protein
MQTGIDWVNDFFRLTETHTVYLEDGERVIGYKSRSDPKLLNHYDFQLIIGRLV